MTLRTKVAEALRAELKRQDVILGDPHAVVSQYVKVHECIDLEALADAALEARKRWHRATDPGAK